MQDKILDMVANSRDDILEDRNLKIALDESKIQSVQIEQTLKDMENTMKQIKKMPSQKHSIVWRVQLLAKM